MFIYLGKLEHTFIRYTELYHLTYHVIAAHHYLAHGALGRRISGTGAAILFSCDVLHFVVVLVSFRCAWLANRTGAERPELVPSHGGAVHSSSTGTAVLPSSGTVLGATVPLKTLSPLAATNSTVHPENRGVVPVVVAKKPTLNV